VIGVFLILVFEADVKTARASEDVAIFLASFTYSGCIHDWQELLHIINQHLVEQSLIPFLEVHNSHILLQWILIRADIVKNALYLEFLRNNCGWQKAAQVVTIPLFFCECGSLVVHGIPQELHPTPGTVIAK
jgi:hypothetical protein